MGKYHFAGHAHKRLSSTEPIIIIEAIVIDFFSALPESDAVGVSIEIFQRKKQGS